jgi:hypothetical protein
LLLLLSSTSVVALSIAESVFAALLDGLIRQGVVVLAHL